MKDPIEMVRALDDLVPEWREMTAEEIRADLSKQIDQTLDGYNAVKALADPSVPDEQANERAEEFLR